jgi:hypothetical protein
LINKLPRSTGLTLDKEGFIIRNMFRRSSHRRSDVSDFAAVQIGATKMVAFNLLSAAQDKLAKLGFAKQVVMVHCRIPTGCRLKI